MFTLKTPLSGFGRTSRRFTRIIFRGVGQVFLQRSAGAGALIVLGLALQSIPMALAALLGSLGATIVNLAIHGSGKPGSCAAGLYGFNGALAGLCAVVFFAQGPWVWALVLLASMLAGLIAAYWPAAATIRPYTAPFVLVGWLLLAAGDALQWAASAAPISPVLGLDSLPDAVLRGVGQVMFLDDPVSGLCCVLGLWLHSWRAGLSALAASAGGLAIAWLVGLPMGLAALGLYGFNAVLTAEALRGGPPGTALWVSAGVGLSVGITALFQAMSLSPLTAPFVLSTWLLLSLRARCAAPGIRA